MSTQINLFDMPSLQNTVSLTNNPDTFGCCSRYLECSAAHACLIPDTELSSGCLYRRNLESGKTFFGKSADGFSSTEYIELLQRIDALSTAGRQAFNWLLIDFCEYHRATSRCIVRNEHIAELSVVGLFDFLPLGAWFLPEQDEKWNYTAILSLVTSHADYASLFRQAQDAREKERALVIAARDAAKARNDTQEVELLERKLKNEIPGKNTKPFLRHWLNHDAVSLRDLLAAPYRFAVLRPDMALYAEALYRDTLLSEYDSRIYPLSPYAADGFLTPFSYEEEELRRVKLSHGYSLEEKSQRVTAIQQARAARVEKRKKDKQSESDGDET